MKKADWVDRITRACSDAGTYRPYFDDVIETLAAILEKRDDAQAMYEKSGSQPIIRHVNKGGASNPAKNPALVLWDDLNKSALVYWRDLGLTPSGLKKLNEDALKEKRGGFENLLSGLGL